VLKRRRRVIGIERSGMTPEEKLKRRRRQKTESLPVIKWKKQSQPSHDQNGDENGKWNEPKWTRSMTGVSIMSCHAQATPPIQAPSTIPRERRTCSSEVRYVCPIQNRNRNPVSKMQIRDWKKRSKAIPNHEPQTKSQRGKKNQ
jgi:hypothetical protein